LETALLFFELWKILEALEEIYTNRETECKTQSNAEANLNLRNQNRGKKYQENHNAQKLTKDKGVQSEEKDSKLDRVTNSTMFFQSQNANYSSHIKRNSPMESQARYGSASVL